MPVLQSNRRIRKSQAASRRNQDWLWKVANHDSAAGQEVSKGTRLIGSGDGGEADTSLRPFEIWKEQNPVDWKGEKRSFQQLEPKFENLQKAISAKDLEATREAYKKMNSTWTTNESVSAETTAQPIKVKRAISFLRSAIETGAY